MKKLIVSLLCVGMLWGTASQLYAASRHAHQASPRVHHVKKLPAGAVLVSVAGVSYWLADTVYYRQADTGYVVVTPSVGTHFKRLPAGAVVVHRNGRQYYRHGNVYYRWLPGKKLYVVD